VPQSKEVSSTLQVLAEPPRPSKEVEYTRNQVTRPGQVKQQVKPKNTQLSAQLLVDLETPSSSQGGGQGAWAVYEPQKLGNSPIYIAPSQYSVEDSRPYKFAGYTSRKSFNQPTTSLVRAGEEMPSSPTSSPTSTSTSTRTSTSSAYDPFYPTYRRSAALQMTPDRPVVVVEQGAWQGQEQGAWSQAGVGEVVEERPYFPNYFPRQAV